MAPPPSPELADHRRALAGTTLSALFARDPDRFAHLSIAWDDWLFDVERALTGAALLVAHARAASFETRALRRRKLNQSRPPAHGAACAG
jgi:hypothetical protein